MRASVESVAPGRVSSLRWLCGLVMLFLCSGLFFQGRQTGEGWTKTDGDNMPQKPWTIFEPGKLNRAPWDEGFFGPRVSVPGAMAPPMRAASRLSRHMVGYTEPWEETFFEEFLQMSERLSQNPENPSGRVLSSFSSRSRTYCLGVRDEPDRWLFNT